MVKVATAFKILYEISHCHFYIHTILLLLYKINFIYLIIKDTSVLILNLNLTKSFGLTFSNLLN